MTELKLETWNCECGYNMPGKVDPYSVAFVAKYLGVQRGGCPSCATHPNPLERKHSALYKTDDESRMTTTISASDAELEAQEKEDHDPNGQPIMVESGQYREKLINDNGTPRFIQEPVMVPKMRPIDKSTVDALKLQRNQSLDKLSKVAVKEVTKEPTPSPDEPIARG